MFDSPSVLVEQPEIWPAARFPTRRWINAFSRLLLLIGAALAVVRRSFYPMAATVAVATCLQLFSLWHARKYGLSAEYERQRREHESQWGENGDSYWGDNGKPNNTTDDPRCGAGRKPGNGQYGSLCGSERDEMPEPAYSSDGESFLSFYMDPIYLAGLKAGDAGNPVPMGGSPTNAHVANHMEIQGKLLHALKHEGLHHKIDAAQTYNTTAPPDVYFNHVPNQRLAPSGVTFEDTGFSRAADIVGGAPESSLDARVQPMYM